MRLRCPVRSHTVRALPLPEELACLGITSFAQRFKVTRVDFPTKSDLFRAPTLPVADNTFALGVIVAMFEVPGCISRSFRHGADREHKTIPSVATSVAPSLGQPGVQVQLVVPRFARADPSEPQPTRRSVRQAPCRSKI